ncbi:aquaporin-8b [Colossoma macropomum]|uniref:aquaporin-8b n=1 Tax=Colossoma macropomum TaxID=42526 RepID=UPI00186472E2|nr:aquaporin-8b [Colossoma macropomum]
MAEEKLELDNMETLMDKPKKGAARGSNKYERIVQPCIAELIGTTFFVFIGCVSVIENVETAGRLQPALVHGLAVAVLIACMAEISGSHFNPPFTMAIYLCGGIELFLVVPYVTCQLIGGVLGAAMAKLMTTNENYGKAHGAAFTVLQSDEQLLQALFGEIAMTWLITMVVLLGAVNSKSKSPLVPFLVGSTVIINVLAGGDVSGTCLNPARAMGPALMTGYWTYHWVYWVGPITGSVIAAASVRILLGDQKMRILWK